MEQYIYDETNGLRYERDGDYYIPCLKLPKTHIGIWGERYLTYIREHKKLLHTKLMVAASSTTTSPKSINRRKKCFLSW